MAITAKEIASTIRHDVIRAYNQWLASRKELAVMLAEHGTEFAGSLQHGMYDENRDTDLTTLEQAKLAEAEWCEWAQIVQHLTDDRRHPCRLSGFDLYAYTDEAVIAAARHAIEGCDLSLSGSEDNSSLDKAEWSRLNREAARTVGGWLKGHVEQYDKRQAATAAPATEELTDEQLLKSPLGTRVREILFRQLEVQGQEWLDGARARHTATTISAGITLARDWVYPEDTWAYGFRESETWDEPYTPTEEDYAELMRRIAARDYNVSREQVERMAMDIADEKSKNNG